ncbi:hypothetical protein ACIRP5_37025 [Streptomyces sp. NPDC101221]|uniref:hypothetical protein n=1 Tax=Streptomyces sp. NPDC101221 TaxID=3366132 RepID=UPI00380E4AC2
MEVVLGAPQVEGEGFVEDAEGGQGLLESFDGLGGGFEDGVEVVGGGIVGGVLGDGSPLFGFASPVEEVCAGEDEVVAVLAVEFPGAGSAVDDGLVGAESAVGGGAAAGEVQGQGQGCLAVDGGGVAGEEFAWVGAPGPATQMVFRTSSRSLLVIFT